LMAYMQMKGKASFNGNLILELENHFYLKCTNYCSDYHDDLLNDKERTCLSDCNKKIRKFVQIARKQFADYEDDIKSVQKMIIWTSSTIFAIKWYSTFFSPFLIIISYGLYLYIQSK
jgi:hypothetical protein